MGRRRGRRIAQSLILVAGLIFPDAAAGLSPAPSGQPAGVGPMVALSGSAIVERDDQVETVGGAIVPPASNEPAQSADPLLCAGHWWCGESVGFPQVQSCTKSETFRIGTVAAALLSGTSYVYHVEEVGGTVGDGQSYFGQIYATASGSPCPGQSTPPFRVSGWWILNGQTFTVDGTTAWTGVAPSWDIWGTSGSSTRAIHWRLWLDPVGWSPAMPPGTEHNPPFVNQEQGGDPVSTFTGAFSDTHLDVAIPGRGPSIEFARSYNSNDTRVTTLGPGWTHSYNIRLVDPDGTSDVVLIGPQGRSDRYVWTGTAFTPPLGVHRTLVKNADGTYTATDKSQTSWHFHPSGRLDRIVDRYGNVSTMAYQTSGRLSTVSDPAGRGVLTFVYTNGLLTSVADWATPTRTTTYQYDANGRLWKVTDRLGKITTFAYDGTSLRIATITDARGNVALTNTYDAQARVVTQKDARGLITGDVTTFDYVVNPDTTRVTTITSPTTSFEPSFHPTLADSYDANGWLSQRVTRPSSTDTLTQTFTYDSAANRTSVTDPRGNRTDFCYDVGYDGLPVAGSLANLTRRVEPAPSPGADRPVSLLQYDAKNNLIQTVAPKGVPSGPTVTCSSNLSAINSTYAADFGYDVASVNLLSQTTRYTDPDTGSKTSIVKFEYGDAANPGLVTRVIPPRGNTGPSPDYTYATTSTYYTTGTRAGLLQDVTDPLGNKSSYDYDPVGRLISVVDPLGNAVGGIPSEHTTLFTYDNEDRLRFQTLPAPVSGGSQLVTETRYDEVGNPVVRLDANGQVTTYAYDERDGLFQVKESPNAWTDPASPPAGVITTEYAYDGAGNLTRLTRAKADATYERATDYVYDGRGLSRSEMQYPAWPSTGGALVATFAYDAAGNQTTVVDPLGQTLTVGYNALNRRTSLDYSNPATPDVTYLYDANGNRSQMVDGTGTTTYILDEANRPISVTSPGPLTVAYRYDLDGNRTKLIYPDATAVSYVFDKASQLNSLTDWAARSVSYTYWPDGLVKSALNPNATVTTYAYDNARRLIDLAHTGPSAQLLDRAVYTIDGVGNVTSVNNLLLLPPQYARPDGSSGSNGTWTGTYASINEVVPNDTTLLASPSNPAAPNFYEVSLSDVQTPMDLTGITFRYRYAKSGNNSGKTINLLVEPRQGSTVIASQTHANIPGASGSGWQQGTVTLTPTQAAGITNFADLHLRFTPTSSGGGQSRKAQISWAEVQLPAPPDPTAYGYDRLYRLTSTSDALGARSYTYDPVGNRLTRVAGTTTTYTYDRADRMTSAGALSVIVDANGDLTTKGADTFSYDQASRLKTATVAGATETYAYDGDGVRFSRQVGANPAIGYVSDVNRGLPVTLDDGPRKYVWGLGLVYAVAGTAVEVYHADRLGSVRAITDGTGAVTATYRTDEFGVQTAVTGSSTQPFDFTGEPRDGSGLTYLRTRYYDPGLGRFMSRDGWTGSVAAPQSLDRYAYVGNNPTTNTDPSGRWTLGFCVTAEIQIPLPLLNFGEGSLCIVLASAGQVGVTLTAGAGGGAGVLASSGFAVQVSSGDDIEDLAGLYGIVGASGALGVGLQGEGFGGFGRCDQLVGGVLGGVVVGGGASVQGGATDTDVLFKLGAPETPCFPRSTSPMK